MTEMLAAALAKIIFNKENKNFGKLKQSLKQPEKLLLVLISNL